MKSKNNHVVFVLMILFSSIFFFACSSSIQQKPNIVFIMIDDCSAVEFSCYATSEHPSGNITPAIDALAKEGLQFNTCWASPLCKPARSMLITGKYGCHTGVYGNALSKTTDDFAEINIPMSKVLNDNGYETAISGKWHLPGYAAQESYGWDSYSLLGGYMTPYKKDIVWDGLWFSWSKASETFRDSAVIGQNNDKYPALYWNGCVIENGELMPSDSNTFAPDLCQKFALDFVSKKHDKPFFLYYPLVLPHDPWLGTPDLNNPEKRTNPGINSLIDYVGHYVDQLVTKLKDAGVYENTIVFFTADNATLANGKGTCSELGVRVPLLVFGGPVKGRGITNALVDFSDMYPTVLESAGLDFSNIKGLDGQSFAALIRGEKYAGKSHLFSYLDMERTVRTKDYMMDGSGGIWNCAPNGNLLDYIPMNENEETQRIRAELVRYTEQFALPQAADYGEKRIEKASRSYNWPEHHPTTLEAFKNQNAWMYNPRRFRE